ncbi:hypothetical protein BCR35DRAFT_298154 [Leucosporidium creatinivorum]|uniref:F-box domain-containing protein n=1 Tax=Leucosporidium creatinivorum TaxID=106004 RepID=A0A1Y2G593_9BASI|nr:hypothetical protein BCR35DRAFT_298154 [Leucosporidium creatinivorum]
MSTGASKTLEESLSADLQSKAKLASHSEASIEQLDSGKTMDASSQKKREAPLKLLDLPETILSLIAAHLDQATLLRFAFTSTRLRPIARRSTLFSYDGTSNRTGRFLSLLEDNLELGPNVRLSAFEPIDRDRPADFQRKTAFHLFKSVAGLCPNLEELAVHHLPAVDDAATQGTLFMALSKLTKLRVLELGSMDSSSYPADAPGRPSWNPPLPSDMLLWSIAPLTELRALTAVVGGSKAASLLAKQRALPPSTGLKEVQLVLKDPVQDSDFVALAARTFPNAHRLTLTIDSNKSLTGAGLTEAFTSLSPSLLHFVLTESGPERRGTYFDPILSSKPSRFPSLSTLAINGTSISPSTLSSLPTTLIALILDLSTSPQGRDSPTPTVSTTLLDLLTNQENFLPELKSLILLGVQREKELWTRMAFKMACAKRGIEPLIAPSA